MLSNDITFEYCGYQVQVKKNKQDPMDTLLKYKIKIHNLSEDSYMERAYVGVISDDFLNSVEFAKSLVADILIT